MTDRPALVKARAIVADMVTDDSGDGTTGRILNQAWRDELTAKIANAIDATVTLATVGELPSAYVIGPCADCRFWKEPEGVLEPHNRPGLWRECTRAFNTDSALTYDALSMVKDSDYGDDYGAVMTRADFGCVQFERKESDGDRQ